MNTSLSQFAIILSCLLCAIMFNTAFSSFNIRCNQIDKHALLNFKQGVIDPSGVLSSWSTEPNCCKWKGVTCDNITSRVTQLSLPCSTTLASYVDTEDKSHCLTGSIYLSLLLKELEFLSYLNLRNNDFSTIQFDSVHAQNCHSNLSVASSRRQCANSSTLHYLDLSLNDNLAINSLRWLPQISSLEYLDIGEIDLHKETNWLQLVTMLPSLSVLIMRSCRLEDLSLSLPFVNFTALKALDLSKNDFNSELPNWLFNLSCGISDLNLGINFLRGHLPKALSNLRELEVLVLEDNKFDGPIPDWLGELEHLQGLVLGGNMFSGSIPTNLGNLSSLTQLTVGGNQLTGVLSDKIFAKLSKLKLLYLDLSPPLIFDFDSLWIPPFQLEELVIGFGGPNFPTWLYTQIYLESLWISDSSFVATEKFWNFASRLTELILQNNAIDGNLSNLLLNSTFIDMSSNGLKGGVPRLSPNVAIASLSNNSLSGDISALLCDDKMLKWKNNLEFLDISLNHLSGGLTDCWKNWKSLVAVHLGSNNLTGKIPSSMGLLSNLTSLHLHENNLYGEIPPSLQNCHSLLVLNLRNNHLSGNIPNWISHGVMALQLRSNNFSGKIPPQICQMSSLIILDIADNTISGHLPSCLANITALVFNNASENRLTSYFPSFRDRFFYNDDSLELVTKGQVLEYKKNLHFMTLMDMSSNNLSGTIPPQMFSLIGMHSLNLSHNKLTGKVPNEIGNMKNLESLDFSANQLWGEIPQSLSYLSFLAYLNLSFNNFTGKIPSGTQLQGFSALSYMGNPGLCGPPLIKSCLQEGNPKGKKAIDEDGDKSEFLQWFYIGIESGFATGFIGVCCAIFLNTKWRHAYFKFLYDLRDRIYRMVFININRFR